MVKRLRLVANLLAFARMFVAKALLSHQDDTDYDDQYEADTANADSDLHTGSGISWFRVWWRYFENVLFETIFVPALMD